MTSSHSQEGPSGHHSTPQPQPQPQSQPRPQAQSHSQPADGQPTPSRTPPASGRPSDETPIHTSRVDGTTTTTNQESAPSRNLPPSSDPPAHPVQTSAPHGEGIPPRRRPDDDHMNNSNDLVENWLITTDQRPPQSVQAETAEQHVAPPDAAVSAAAASAAAAAIAVESHAHNGLPSDFAKPDVAMLGQDTPQDFVQGLPAGLPVTEDPYLPIPSENLPLSWSLPGPFTFQPGIFQPGVSVSQGNGEDMSDDDAASLDEPVLDGTSFDRMARLEFADTFVAITTNTTIIGRDQRVYKRAVMNKKRAEGGLSPVSRTVPQKRGHYSKSYVSQEGGALGPESDGEGRSRSSKRRRTVDNGQYTLSPKQQTPAADDPSAPDNVISSRQYVDHTPGAVPVDMENLRPSSDDVARIDIHGAGPDIIETSKGISRDHLKIQYDEENRVWQATAIGRNGFFCEERLYHKDEVVTLRSGSHLQIQAVGFIFTISGVEDGKLGNEEPRAYFEDGKKMSLDFSNSRLESDMRSTDDALSSPLQIPTATAMLDTDDSDDSDSEAHGSTSPKPAVKDVARKTEPEEPIRPTIESDHVKEPMQTVGLDASQAVVPPKKRGPGRPPKNGVMSKREERELKKKREEEDKKNNPPQEPGNPPTKRKVGRPRKHPRPEDEGDQPEKRKYKSRKPKNEDGEDDEDPEGEKADKQKRLQKPKTPPLDLGKKEDFTEEQLQKPNKNYQTLIDEVLSKGPEEGLTLKQIYKRIARQYPYFFFMVDTKGWESSVRHNLIGSHCFEKNQETHLWKRVQGIPLESGKKRKASDTAAEPRGPPIYNGNFNPSHGYQPPPHPQQYPNQHMVPTGGGPPMNGMSRYQPSVQAHPAAIPNSTHPGTAPSQQAAPRPGFPQHTPQQQQRPQQPPPTPTTVPHASTYAATAGPPRPQYPSSQQHSYNPAFNQRPQQAPVVHGTATGTHQIQNHAQHPLTGRPGQGAQPTSQRGAATVHTGPVQQNQRAPSLPHPQQPVSNTVPPAALGPAVEPSLREFLGKFSGEVVKQLQGRVKRPHAVAVSVINRGLGLTDMSLAPEHENFEKAIISIFHTHKLTYSKPKATTVSTAATEPSRPPVPTTAPAVNGSGTTAAAGSAPVAPAPVHATPISAHNGSAPSGSAATPTGSGRSGSAPIGSGAAASKVNGSLTAPANAPNGTTVGTHPVLGRNDSSTTEPAPAGPTAPSTAPQPAHTSTAVGAGDPSGSSTGAQSNGVPKVNSPVPPRSSATPAPGTPAPDANSVQLLDPELVEVIQQYKNLSQQVLTPQVGKLQAEILVMSAVNRVLGFTTETIVPHNSQDRKLGLREAEDALINSLRPRIDTYLRNKQAPSAVPSAAPTTSMPTPVHAPSTIPTPLSAPSR
ncbi:hypothetical protein LA080_005633 [Diaporthe eres]|uniref:Fork-head domain-containing protein n=1 Tax=Diaporthe vaccinii TaxID=105482 RepID=A0ABR4F140_9PEZI|nr:hypothetical protein LA080_005633 [Diaporthe eres]